jgi:hypothetical protein
MTPFIERRVRQGRRDFNRVFRQVFNRVFNRVFDRVFNLGTAKPKFFALSAYSALNKLALNKPEGWQQ